MRIVVVDDSAVERSQAERILKQGGHEVVALCENGELGIKAALEHNPDVVMMDMMMIEMTGDAAAIKLRELGYKGGIVFATKNSQPAVLNTLKFVNGALVVKMYKPEALLAAVLEAKRKVS